MCISQTTFILLRNLQATLQTKKPTWYQHHHPIHRPHSSQLPQQCAFPLLVQDLLQENVSHLVLICLQFLPVWKSSFIFPCVLSPRQFERAGPYILYDDAQPTQCFLTLSRQEDQRWDTVFSQCTVPGGAWQ